MAVLQMQKISICALKKNRKGILEELQKTGSMEIIPDAGEDPSFEKMDVAGSRATFERTAHMADQALEILQEYVPEKKSL
ncbi:MAG: V-type ATP synthase subunit I, partial [Lachnospiraceae bacterium]|nr:V-type ATP synthase subunit I [Lachnospiraceae bacterium]